MKRSVVVLFLAIGTLFAAADEKLFLDPYLKSEMKELAGRVVLDTGLCSGEIYAGSGAKVCMVAFHESTQMPYENGYFDEAVSSYVGALLTEEELNKHMAELSRVMKEGSEARIAAPASLDVLFTRGNVNDHALFHRIEQLLANVENEKMLEEKMKELADLNHATFVKRAGRFTLVTDASKLTLGEQIWRKEGDIFTSGYFHNDEQYLMAIANAGLKCVEIKRPCFFGAVKYNIYHNELHADEQSLGLAYIENNPYTIFVVVK